MIRLFANHPKVVDGKECHGYMDYNDGETFGDYTNGWSHCSVQDFTAYIEENNNANCLRPVTTPVVTTPVVTTTTEATCTGMYLKNMHNRFDFLVVV